MQAVIHEALSAAGLSPTQVDMLSMHGTGEGGRLCICVCMRPCVLCAENQGGMGSRIDNMALGLEFSVIDRLDHHASPNHSCRYCSSLNITHNTKFLTMTELRCSPAGTPLGDPIEVNAATTALLPGSPAAGPRPSPLALLASKSWSGHGEPAAGVIAMQVSGLMGWWVTGATTVTIQ